MPTFVCRQSSFLFVLLLIFISVSWMQLSRGEMNDDEGWYENRADGREGIYGDEYQNEYAMEMINNGNI